MLKYGTLDVVLVNCDEVKLQLQSKRILLRLVHKNVTFVIIPLCYFLLRIEE